MRPRAQPGDRVRPVRSGQRRRLGIDPREAERQRPGIQRARAANEVIVDLEPPLPVGVLPVDAGQIPIGREAARTRRRAVFDRRRRFVVKRRVGEVLTDRLDAGQEHHPRAVGTVQLHRQVVDERVRDVQRDVDVGDRARQARDRQVGRDRSVVGNGLRRVGRRHGRRAVEPRTVAVQIGEDPPVPQPLFAAALRLVAVGIVPDDAADGRRQQQARLEGFQCGTIGTFRGRRTLLPPTAKQTTTGHQHHSFGFC